MARTGTSMMMHALIKGGIPALYDVGKADPRLTWLKERGYDANPDGLFELYKPNLYERWPDDLDGEAVKVQDWQWDKLKKLSPGMSVIYMRRQLEPCFKSWYAFTGNSDRNKWLERYNRQDLIIERLKRRDDLVRFTEVEYELVVDNPKDEFMRLWEIGWPLDPHKAASVVNPEYQHFKE